MFTQGYDNSNFLKATPLSDTNNPITLMYGTFYIRDWLYDDEAEALYVICDSVLRKYVKENGTFSNTYTVIAGTDDGKFGKFGFDDVDPFRNLFTNTWESRPIVSWRGYLNTHGENYIILNDDDTLKAENLQEALLRYSWDSLSESIRYVDESSTPKYFTSADVDLRFDLFEDIAEYKVIATITKGKKNAEALAALDTSEGRHALYSLLSGERYKYSETWSSYPHNFFADVLYVKDSDVLLADTEYSYFSKII
jgi:hypothetical protein